MKTRFIVCPIIRNKDNEYLICKMPKTRGVFPGQWGISGGGVEEGEEILEALQREIKEELGDNLKISEIIPWWFKDDKRIKLYPDGSTEKVYMVYLMFDCTAENKDIILNEEFEEYAWVKPENLKNYDLNEATKGTFQKKGFL